MNKYSLDKVSKYYSKYSILAKTTNTLEQKYDIEDLKKGISKVEEEKILF